MTTPTMKPCPFCGGNDVAVVPAEDEPDYEGDYPVVAACMDCSTNGPSHEFKSAAEAIAAWNRRPSPGLPQSGVVESMMSSLCREMEIDDIEERLRKRTKGTYYGDIEELCAKAADLIGWLRTEREQAATLIASLRADDEQMRHDIERLVKTCASLATENASLRGALEPLNELVLAVNAMPKLTDEEAAQSISVLLASYKFPDLKVRPDLRDEARQSFASQLVRRLKTSGIRLHREDREDDAGKNSKFFGVDK